MPVHRRTGRAPSSAKEVRPLENQGEATQADRFPGDEDDPVSGPVHRRRHLQEEVPGEEAIQEQISGVRDELSKIDDLDAEMDGWRIFGLPCSPWRIPSVGITSSLEMLTRML